MGYAGDSRTATGYLDGSTREAAGYPGILGHEVGRGIQPPKIAIEFDPYTNYGSADVCAVDSRRDGNEVPPRNHAGYVFWGDNTNSACDTTVGRNTYDDNRHNWGNNTPSDPKNSMRPSDGADPSYYNASATWPYNWLLSNAPTNIYTFRVEVTRSKTPNAGNYEYTVKSWVKQCAVDIACATYGEASSFANTKVDYTADAPTLTRTTPIALESTLHQKFNTFFFGWTTATGGATQNILINRFKINFRN